MEAQDAAPGPLGIELSTYSADLRRVPAHLRLKPARGFDAWERIGPEARSRIMERYGQADEACLESYCSSYPLSAFASLTFDELCKVRHSRNTMMSSDVESLFDCDPRYVVVRKIESSVWRWGHAKADWNELVDAYDGIRRFDLSLHGFDAVLDHTTGWNEKGYSEHSRTYLDGVFGLVVRHRGRHAMTIGFSFAGRRRILLQQVQLARRSGNRWLYRFPANRLEFVIGRLAAAFPRHAILVADGASLAERTLRSYEQSLKESRHNAARHRQSIDCGQACRWEAGWLASALEAIERIEGRIAHLAEDAPRLAAFYADAGRHDLGAETVTINGLGHHAVVGTPRAPARRRARAATSAEARGQEAQGACATA